MKYEEALKYVYSLPNCSFKRYGLSGILKLLEVLENPQNNKRYIHIAGTNGKGSVVSFCSKALQAFGLKTGVYISPYVVDFRERIQIDDRYISKDEFSSLVFRLKKIVDWLNGKGTFLTAFDFVTALAIEYFNIMNCDIVVLEVGMGGRLDSTNVIKKPEVSILTHIDYDHIKELGGKEKSLINIAKEKLGILKKGTVCISDSNQNEEIISLIKSTSFEKNIKLFFAPKPSNVLCSKDYTEFKVFDETFRTKLLGPHQARNGAVAVTALLKGINLDINYVKKGLEEAFIPARMEIIKNTPLIILDGAHNANGVEALKEALKIFPNTPKIGVVSIINTKDYKAMFKNIKGIFNNLVITKMEYEKGLSGNILKAAADEVGLFSVLEGDFKKAVSLAKKLAEKKGLVVFFGSLYFIGQVRRFLY